MNRLAFLLLIALAFILASCSSARYGHLTRSHNPVPPKIEKKTSTIHSADHSIATPKIEWRNKSRTTSFQNLNTVQSPKMKQVEFISLKAQTTIEIKSETSHKHTKEAADLYSPQETNAASGSLIVLGILVIIGSVALLNWLGVAIWLIIVIILVAIFLGIGLATISEDW